MRISGTSRCNCYIVYCRRPRKTIHVDFTTIILEHVPHSYANKKWDMYATEKKILQREQFFLKGRAVSISISDRHLWHTQPSQIREQRTWPFARTYTYNTFLASRLEFNITHICGCMLTLTLLRCSSTPTSRRHREGAPAACEKPTEHIIFQRENAGCIPPRVDNA